MALYIPKTEYYSLPTPPANTGSDTSDHWSHVASVTGKLNALIRERIDLRNQPWVIDLFNRTDSLDHLTGFILEVHPIVTNHYKTLVTLCRYHHEEQLDNITFIASFGHVNALLDDFILSINSLSGPTSVITPFINDWAPIATTGADDCSINIRDCFLEITQMVADARKMKNGMLELAREKSRKREAREREAEEQADWEQIWEQIAREQEAWEQQAGEQQAGEREAGEREAGEQEAGEQEAGEKLEAWMRIWEKEAEEQEAAEQEAGEQEHKA